jgi:hypothetical protein
MLTKISDYIFLSAHAQATTGGGRGGALDFFNFNFVTNSPGNDANSIFNSLLGKIMTWVLAVIFLIAFIYLIMSGVKYITSGGDAGKATEARNGVLNAIIGIVIVLLAYVILQFAGKLGEGIGGGR